MVASLNEEQVLEFLSEMKIRDAWDFALKLGHSLGMDEEQVKSFLSPSATVVASAEASSQTADSGSKASAEEDSRTEFNVILKSVNADKKIETIKILRTYFTSVSLKDAKTHVESAMSGKAVDLGVLEADKFKKLEKDLASGTDSAIASVAKE